MTTIACFNSEIDARLRANRVVLRKLFAIEVHIRNLFFYIQCQSNKIDAVAFDAQIKHTTSSHIQMDANNYCIFPRRPNANEHHRCRRHASTPPQTRSSTIATPLDIATVVFINISSRLLLSARHQQLAYLTALLQHLLQ